MNTTETIYQCEACQRQFKDDLRGLMLLERPRLVANANFIRCEREDCAAVAAANRLRDQERQHRDCRPYRPVPNRAHVKSACRSAARSGEESEVPRPKFQPATYLERSLPPEPQEKLETGDLKPEPVPLTTNLGAVAGFSEVVEKVLPAVPGGVAETARSFGQREFEASGAAASQNARLVKFFSEPHNRGKFFKASFLEGMSGSRRMNNRAVDLRKRIGEGGADAGFIEAGLYLDNCMMRDGHTDKLASYYGLFPIAQCRSLGVEEKERLLAGQMSRNGAAERPAD